MNGLAIVANPLKRRKSRTTKRRRNPISNLGAYAKRKSSGKRKSSRRRSTSRALSAAPAATRSRSVRRSRRRRHSSSGGGTSVVRRVSRVASSSLSGVVSAIGPAAIGAGGALGIDLIWGLLPLPDSVKTSPILGPIARIAAAAGVGMAARALGGRKFGNEAMAGALIVTLFDVAKGAIKNHTTFPLSYYSGPRRLGYYPAGGGYHSDFFDPQGYDDSVVYATGGGYG